MGAARATLIYAAAIMVALDVLEVFLLEETGLVAWSL